jgi:hypothetical protein
VELTDPVSRDQRHLDGSLTLCAPQWGTRGIDGFAPPANLGCRKAGQHVTHRRAARWIDRRLLEQRLEQRAQIETGPSNHERRSTRGRDRFEPGLDRRVPVGRGVSSSGWHLYEGGTAAVPGVGLAVEMKRDIPDAKSAEMIDAPASSASRVPGRLS